MRPFDHKNYHRNEDRITGDDSPCVVCGKGVKDRPGVLWVCVVDGGATYGVAGTSEGDAGYMGYFPVGPTCTKKHRVFWRGLGYAV